MGKIFLNDLLEINDFSNWKIKLNIYNGHTEPMIAYTKNPDVINKDWLFWRNERRNFKVGQTAVCLLKIDCDRWLLTTIKEGTKELDVKQGKNYEGVELRDYDKYFGRVVIKYHKGSAQGVPWYKNVMNELEVIEILPSVYDGVDFPGYDRVHLSHKQLDIIISRGKTDWINALKHQKAVYLIRDNNNGKIYIGSATGQNDMLLSRWSSYVANGHGGNKELKNIVDDPTQGFDYIKDNFYYSILENYNSRVDKNYIIDREMWWKNVLGTRVPFGYNLN